MLAHGARCSIGDHLHPTGRIDQSTMGVIAPAYKWVAEREAWAADTTNRAEIALLSVEAASRPSLVGVPGHHAGPDEGAVRVLLEGKFAFDVVDLDSDYSQYRLLILPDAIAVDGSLKAKVEKYVAERRQSAAHRQERHRPRRRLRLRRRRRMERHLAQRGGDYVLPVDVAAGRFRQRSAVHVPAGREDQHSRTARRSARSTSPISTARRGISPATSMPPASPTPAHSPPVRARAASPISPSRSFPATIRSASVAMLEIAEKLIENALGGKRLVTTSLPRAGRVTVRAQAGQKRDVVHLLHATPALRGTTRGAPVQPIQDLDHPEQRPGHRGDHRQGQGSEARSVGRSPGVHSGCGRRRLRGAERDRAPDGGDRLLAATSVSGVETRRCRDGQTLTP